MYGIDTQRGVLVYIITSLPTTWSALVHRALGVVSPYAYPGINQTPLPIPIPIPNTSLFLCLALPRVLMMFHSLVRSVGVSSRRPAGFTNAVSWCAQRDGDPGVCGLRLGSVLFCSVVVSLGPLSFLSSNPMVLSTGSHTRFLTPEKSSHPSSAPRSYTLPPQRSSPHHASTPSTLPPVVPSKGGAAPPPPPPPSRPHSSGVRHRALQAWMAAISARSAPLTARCRRSLFCPANEGATIRDVKDWPQPPVFWGGVGLVRVFAIWLVGE